MIAKATRAIAVLTLAAFALVPTVGGSWPTSQAPTVGGSWPTSQDPTVGGSWPTVLDAS